MSLTFITFYMTPYFSKWWHRLNFFPYETIWADFSYSILKDIDIRGILYSCTLSLMGSWKKWEVNVYGQSVIMNWKMYMFWGLVYIARTAVSYFIYTNRRWCPYPDICTAQDLMMLWSSIFTRESDFFFKYEFSQLRTSSIFVFNSWKWSTRAEN